MTTTTGDPSTLKTPASLSGGDLVNRLLAATPPYLYNVPLTPNSFFFSEMLRSFVQAKADTSPIEPIPSTPRRRKRSWKDTRDRPLELTTKERHHHHHHHQGPLSHQQQGEKYFHSTQHYEQQQQQQQHHHHPQQQQQQQQPQILDSIHLENQNKSLEAYDIESKNLNLEQKSQDFSIEILKSVDENRSKFKPSKNYFADRIPNLQENIQSIFLNETQKVKPEDSERNCTFSEKDNLEERCQKTSSELSFLAEQKSKLDFNARNFLPTLPGRGDELQQSTAKGFSLPTGNVPNPEFLPNPLWYPPYPMPQSYPGIDPLHFFIDLRVSGHIWDRKLNERHLPFKSKHSSAFSVPQAKEYNRPLNLTRDEASSTSRSCEANHQGTHYILKHITKTYKDIKEAEKDSRTEITEVTIEEDSPNSEELESSKKEETSNSTSNQDEEKKDLRALIGLELVVDYVKEPKGESSSSECSPQITE
ncbi:homeobox protein 13 [Leptopilina heterotoma]|uniref:homeobox protein 13 n=1 Tax=Leptopilina heterotoma TaxID=63436 RepID=UPI001CA825B1|nr:homeobox protein 13 [Leptopilina heterotoma]